MPKRLAEDAPAELSLDGMIVLPGLSRNVFEQQAKSEDFASSKRQKDNFQNEKICQ